MQTQTKFFLIQSYPHIKGVSMKKNFNTIKAAIIMGIMIIFCIVSILFFNKQTSSTPPVLATQSQPQKEEETTKAKINLVKALKDTLSVGFNLICIDTLKEM